MASTKYDLSGKTALITGAVGLLGMEHAAALLESGADVVLTDICENNLIEAAGKLSNQFHKSKVYAQSMDVACLEGIQTVAEKLGSEGIRIDILINNAAINPKFGKNINSKNLSRLENFKLEDWNKELSVGLTGAFLCTQIFGNQMACDGIGGVIVNIASDLSIIAPDQRLYRKSGLSEEQQPTKPVTYSVIKTGIIGLTRYVASYWADKGVRCNALSPGGVNDNQGDEFVRKINNLIPMKRMANVDEYKSAIQFLCSDASKYMTGQNLVIDGGRSIL